MILLASMLLGQTNTERPISYEVTVSPMTVSTGQPFCVSVKMGLAEGYSLGSLPFPEEPDANWLSDLLSHVDSALHEPWDAAMAELETLSAVKIQSWTLNGAQPENLWQACLSVLLVGDLQLTLPEIDVQYGDSVIPVQSPDVLIGFASRLAVGPDGPQPYGMLAQLSVPESTTPWTWVLWGLVILILAGGLLLFLIRRRHLAHRVETEPLPSLTAWVQRHLPESLSPQSWRKLWVQLERRLKPMSESPARRSCQRAIRQLTESLTQGVSQLSEDQRISQQAELLRVAADVDALVTAKPARGTIR